MTKLRVLAALRQGVIEGPHEVGLSWSYAQATKRLGCDVERQISEDEVEVGFTIDASGIVETLRSLPDGAGTDAFVAAYNART
jgi:hypothetical protein